MNPHDYTFVDPQVAFEHAIKSGFLTTGKHDVFYVGDYMYMGTCRIQGHAFKHVICRSYRYVPVAP